VQLAPVNFLTTFENKIVVNVPPRGLQNLSQNIRHQQDLPGAEPLRTIKKA
jgi:hypothetical protein